jgi:outer membrane protein
MKRSILKRSILKSSIKQSLVLMVMVSCAGFASAAGKIAIVNVQRAIVDTDTAQQRLESLRKEADFKSNMKEVEAIKEEGEALLEKYKKDGPVMSPEQQAALQKKIQGKQADLEHIARKLQAREQEVLQEIMAQKSLQAKTAIDGIIKKEGIGLLLDSRTALHAEPGYDITAQVTQKLNSL